MATFGIIISNRSFFPDHLVRTAREKLLAARRAGINLDMEIKVWPCPLY